MILLFFSIPVFAQNIDNDSTVSEHLADKQEISDTFITARKKQQFIQQYYQALDRFITGNTGKPQ